ncbi:MAG: DEAD/DEAH box helicase [Spirochaetaceae bacterium]|nr:DEAD/DEAH box helicase [Spirochaetaceae bacterium]
MTNFNLWIIEDGFKALGDSPWVMMFNIYPLDTLFNYIKSGEKIEDEALDYLVQVATRFLKEASQKDVIELENNPDIELDESNLKILLDNVPLVLGNEFINESWLKYQYSLMNQWISNIIKGSDKPLEATLASYLPSFNVADRTYFHLVETKEEKFPFAFYCSYTTMIKNEVLHMPLSYALEEFKDDERQLLHLLSIIFKASGRSSCLSTLIENGELFNPTYLKGEEAYELLKNSAFFETCGIGFRFPSWWKKKNKIHSQAVIGSSLKQGLNLQYLLSVELDFVLNEQTLSESELRELNKREEGLVNFNGKWIEIKHELLEQLLSQFEEFNRKFKKGISFSEYLSMQKNEVIVNNEFPEIEFTTGKWLEDFKNHDTQSFETVELSASFKGKLREYQKKGVSWLNDMLHLGFGSTLADDMGLGKTVQILAILTYLFDKNKINNTLLIVPSSLIGNWIAERDKFAPNLEIFILHDKESVLEKLDYRKKGLYLSTYKMVSLRESIRKQEWDIAILDEAQAIKNPNAKQSKAIKQLNCTNRIIMSGTPIENSLLDLYSLFDFTNPGLLGTKKEFTDLMKQMEETPKLYKALRNVISPFILRRLKTDKTIIQDLPKKIESDYYVPLSAKQVVLYNKLIKEIENSINESEEGIAKKGLILSSILKSKQICNHPSQYLKSEEYKEKDSGKFLALKLLVQTIYEKRERVLIFTQYKTMIAPIMNYLENLLGLPGLSIDGSVSPKDRTTRVNEFNSDRYYPFMVITIKAGGTGLNLTSANHVIHFDRWWNPSVENQATDRAFRIGQTKVVNVYKFICKGTIEDKINEIILSKSKMSSKIIGNSEESTVSWINKLDNSELIKLFEYTK